ncbi:MAG: iron-sulfur cluster assembly protein [Bacteroidales bacterium]|nr:iron-sulfur cluster assembly protein [Bacteroidales bacterium]MCF8389538.1 iron-sulfur cluster assembly protein [Bacteroidales bacterium]
MRTIFEVADVVTKTEHPAINHTLTDLGIVTDIDLRDNTVELVFAFPFPEIPIKDALIASIEDPIREMGLDLNYSIRTMDAEEKAQFMKMEKEAWRK